LWLVKYRSSRQSLNHRYLPVMLKKQNAGLCNFESESGVKGVNHE